nr:hypothetical protein CFP56_69776 [Quercus suber]
MVVYSCWTRENLDDAASAINDSTKEDSLAILNTATFALEQLNHQICDYSSEQNFLARMKMVSFQGVFPVGDGTLSLNGKRKRI